jgi:hypothetical protein
MKMKAPKKSKAKPKGTPYKGSAMIEKNSSNSSKSPKGGTHSGARYRA